MFDHVATGVKPPEFCDSSSLFLMCMLELLCSLPKEQRGSLLESTVRRLVRGCGDDGVQLRSCEPIDLMLWFPPVDFHERILVKSLADEGECATVSLEKMGQSALENGDDIYTRVVSFVAESRSKRPFTYPEWLPVSLLALACLKHRSPLPPEVWRGTIFHDMQEQQAG